MGRNYAVERIVAKRYRNRTLEYLVQWKYYKKPTWEPASNCDCPKLIEAFNKRTRQTASDNGPSQLTRKSSKPPKQAAINAGKSNSILEYPHTSKTYGCQSGLVVEQLLGVKPYSATNQLIGLVVYEDGNYELVPTSILAKWCPNILVNFYEQRLRIVQEPST